MQRFVLIPVSSDRIYAFIEFLFIFGVFMMGKPDRSVRSDRNKIRFFKNYYNLEFKDKGYLTFPVLARLCVHCQKINTNNSKERKPLLQLSDRKDLLEMIVVKN